MGLRRVWLFSCDATCVRQLILYGEDPRVARVEALDEGWETVLRDDGRRTPRTMWFCPQHRFAAMAEIEPEPEHEDWCPRKTRGGGCSCEASTFGPHTYDDAYSGTKDKGVDVVVIPGELL
jgi:hypothetical protein